MHAHMRARERNRILRKGKGGLKQRRKGKSPPQKGVLVKNVTVKTLKIQGFGDIWTSKIKKRRKKFEIVIDVMAFIV